MPVPPGDPDRPLFPPFAANVARAVFIAIIGVLMVFIAVVVGEDRIAWSGDGVFQVLLAVVVAALTVMFMPVKVGGESRDPDTQGASLETLVVVIAGASVAAASMAPLLAGVEGLYIGLAIFGGWLLGLGVKVLLASSQSRGGSL